jgi:NAD(P)H dehydrogenase (quinone)
MRMSPPFVIFGATGAQGNAVVRAAVHQGLPVRAVAGSAKNLVALSNSMGSVTTPLQTMAAQLDDVISLRSALLGAAAAFVHLPIAQEPGQPARWLDNLLLAAAQSKLPWLVFSSSGPAMASWRASPLIDAARAATQAVLSGPVPAVVLQPALYLENLEVPLFVPRLASEGVLDYPPLPVDWPVPFISHHDQALLAVAALTRPDLQGQAFPIASAGALSTQQLAALLQSLRGQPVRTEPLLPEAFGQRVASALGNPALAFLLGDMYQAIAEGGVPALQIDGGALAARLGVRLGTITDRLSGMTVAQTLA